MPVLSNEELTEATRSIEKRLEQLAVPYESALSNRVFESVQKQFRIWLAIWLGVSSTALGLAGYFGYDEIITAGKKKVVEQISSQVETQLQDEIKNELANAREEVKKVLLENSLDDISKLDTELAQILSDTQSAIDQRIKEFATKLAPAIKEADLPKTLTEKPKPSTLKGFAYYGIRYKDGWSERNFRVIGKSDNTFPEKGDIIEAIVPVNARSGIIGLTIRGWVNKPATGLIEPGRQLEVLEVERIAGGSYIWIEFVTKN